MISRVPQIIGKLLADPQPRRPDLPGGSASSPRASA